MNSGSIIVHGSQKTEHYEYGLNLANEVLKKNYRSFTDVLSPDLHIVNNEGESIGIDTIHDISRIIAYKPYIESRILIFIFDAQNLTVEAQNAFLKTLEEPSDYCLISLFTTSLESLLPTVISRCRIYKLDRKNEAGELSDIATTILNMDLIERFDYSAKLMSSDKNRLKSLELVDDLEKYFHMQLVNSKNNPDLSKAADNLKVIKNARIQLMKNANTRIVVENMLLKIKR